MGKLMGSRFVLAAFACIVTAACGDDPNTEKPGGTGSSGSSGSGSMTGDMTTDPGTGGDMTGTTSDGSAEQTCVDTINMYRAKVGAPAYTRWTSEESCADGEAKSDSSSGAAHGAFGSCKEFAQNECPGWPGPAGSMIPQCLAAMWAEGPGGGHYENMKSKQYTQVSCGFYTLPNGKVWAVQNFK